MDVLFVNPRDLSIPAPYVRSACLAAMLQKEQVACRIIEPRAEGVSIPRLIAMVQEHACKLVCISVFPSTLPHAYQTIQALKKHFPQLPVVVEGYMINADTRAVRELSADYGLHGDGENGIVALYKYLCGEQIDLSTVDGLIYFKENELEVNKSGFVRNLNDLPCPAYELLPIGKYYSASTNKRYMIMFTDRGCPYNCSFCANLSQKRYRCLSTENVIKQLQRLVVELNVEWVEFMDLTFTINRRRTIEICQGIIDAGLKFDWACETRADLIDEELLGYMKRAGCNKITIGVESGNEKLRYLTGKEISNQEFIRIFKLCEANGIKTMANFIFGHPGDTAKTISETTRFAIKLNPFNVLFTKMTPLPDVDIYFNGVKNKEVDQDVWYQYMRGEQAFPVYYPKSIAKWKMEFLYRLAFVLFYVRPASIGKYAALFNDPVFAYRSVKVFMRFVFGKTLYK